MHINSPRFFKKLGVGTLLEGEILHGVSTVITILSCTVFVSNKRPAHLTKSLRAGAYLF